MNSRATAARRAGVLYFAFMLIAIVGEFAFPAFRVPGDAAATARNVAAAEQTYRVSILVGLATHVIFLFLVSSLYGLFEEVHRGRARMMVIFVCVGVATALAGLSLKLVPLMLLDGAPSALGRPELEAVLYGSLRLHASATTLLLAFWGLWLLPFGLLVIESRFIPQIFGWLLLVAGAAYLAVSVTGIALPQYRSTVTRLAMPLYFGEVPIIFWLLLKGARAPQPA